MDLMVPVIDTPTMQTQTGDSNVCFWPKADIPESLLSIQSVP